MKKDKQGKWQKYVSLLLSLCLLGAILPLPAMAQEMSVTLTASVQNGATVPAGTAVDFTLSGVNTADLSLMVVNPASGQSFHYADEVSCVLEEPGVYVFIAYGANGTDATALGFERCKSPNYVIIAEGPPETYAYLAKKPHTELHRIYSLILLLGEKTSQFRVIADEIIEARDLSDLGFWGKMVSADFWKLYATELYDVLDNEDLGELQDEMERHIVEATLERMINADPFQSYEKAMCYVSQLSNHELLTNLINGEDAYETFIGAMKDSGLKVKEVGPKTSIAFKMLNGLFSTINIATANEAELAQLCYFIVYADEAELALDAIAKQYAGLSDACQKLKQEIEDGALEAIWDANIKTAGQITEAWAKVFATDISAATIKIIEGFLTNPKTVALVQRGINSIGKMEVYYADVLACSNSIVAGLNIGASAFFGYQIAHDWLTGSVDQNIEAQDRIMMGLPLYTGIFRTMNSCYSSSEENSAELYQATCLFLECAKISLTHLIDYFKTYYEFGFGKLLTVKRTEEEARSAAETAQNKINEIDGWLEQIQRIYAQCCEQTQ